MIVGSRKMFLIAIGFFVLIMIINFPFPHAHPFAEATLSNLKISSRTSSGIHILGLVSVALLFIGIFFLVRSLEKYHVRMVFLAFIVCTLLPHGLADFYQHTLARGIYAVDYDKEFSDCTFLMVDDDTVSGNCRLLFENFSNHTVNFDLRFHGEVPFVEDGNFFPLLNKDAPYKVSLEGNERRTVNLHMEFDVSHLDHFTFGTASPINIQIAQFSRFRNL